MSGSHAPPLLGTEVSERSMRADTGQELPLRRRSQQYYDGQGVLSEQSETCHLSGSDTDQASPRGSTQAEAARRELTPMGSQEFGGDVRDDFDDDPDFHRAERREEHLRQLATWRREQGSFHGRVVTRVNASDVNEELGSSGGSAEPQVLEGLGPGVGPRGEMLGDEWIGYGREPALGPMESEHEAYEEELTI